MLPLTVQPIAVHLVVRDEGDLGRVVTVANAAAQDLEFFEKINNII